MSQYVEGSMAEALGHLDRITSHLRQHGQHQAANEIGKLSIVIVNVFSEAIDNISPSESLMDDFVTHNSGPRMVTNQADVRDSIQKQAVMALMNEVKKEGREDIVKENFALQRISPGNGPSVQPESWAQVASSFSNLPNRPQEAGQYMPPLSVNSCSVSKQSQNSEDEAEVNEELCTALTAVPLPEIPEAKAGIIRIHGKVNRDIIHFITTRIHEGPLQDIRVEASDRTRVVFQHASQAVAFVKSNREMENIMGYGRLGTSYSVELAEIVDWNDDHRRMNQPIRERRRLSFARKRLFADNMSPEKWKQDIRALAGPANIDFVWVFNSGNATAVFTSTTVARKVLDVFNKWKEIRNVYNGVSVTYSSDPCEKELVLVKESNRPNMAKNFSRRPPLRQLQG